MNFMRSDMDPELSLEASIKNCSMWHIATSTRLAFEKVGLPFKDESLKLLSKKPGFSTDISKFGHQSMPYEDSRMSIIRYDIPRDGPLHIMDLPPELLEQVFRNLTFDNVGKIRRVCHHFNTVASSLLNSEFSSLRLNMLHRFQNIKAQMPRRESARRKHPLARESDIIETLHMRLTLLHMTFGKHIERRHCCFFAGEILDEVYRIISYVKTTPNLNRAYKVTDELFDLSQMAMEYFKEHIEPSLPEITYFATDFLEYTPTITSSPKTQVSLLEDSVACSSNMVTKLPSLESMSAANPSMTPMMKKKLRRLTENMKKNSNIIFGLRRELKTSKRKLVQEQKQINDLKSRCEDYDRKFQNTSRKFSAVLQELNRFKTEFQYWRSKSPATPCACGAITPVLDLKEPDFAEDLHLERMSPRSIPQVDLTDDFKPIIPDVGLSHRGVISSCVSYANRFGLETIRQTPAAIGNATSSTHVEKNNFKSACKRKLDMDETPTKNVKIMSSLNRVAFYSDIIVRNTSVAGPSSANIQKPETCVSVDKEFDMASNFAEDPSGYEDDE